MYTHVYGESKLHFFGGFRDFTSDLNKNIK